MTFGSAAASEMSNATSEGKAPQRHAHKRTCAKALTIETQGLRRTPPSEKCNEGSKRCPTSVNNRIMMDNEYMTKKDE